MFFANFVYVLEISKKSHTSFNKTFLFGTIVSQTIWSINGKVHFNVTATREYHIGLLNFVLVILTS